MKYSIVHIKSIVSGEFLSHHQDDLIGYLLTDSRRLIFPDTTLFFALAGSRRSGEQFVEDLYQRGVRNFVVSKKIDVKKYVGSNIILVKNSLEALQQLAAFHRKKFEIPVIGITGSNGKTIVKEWLNQLAEDDYNIVRSPRSYNSQIGVPISVWQMSESSELGIFEAGISQAKEMDNLEKIIKPTIGIFTNIGEAHSEGFSNLQHKIEEKARLFKDASVLIFNGDDINISKVIAANNKSIQLFTWGKNEHAVVRILKIDKTDRNTEVTFLYPQEISSLVIPFTDDASVENAIIVIVTLLYLKITVERIRGKLSRLSPVAMRLELKKGINNCSVINDSYSADINSLKIALDFMLQQQQHKKRTLILSDILESGQQESKLYEEVADLLAQKEVNHLIGIGKNISAEKERFKRLREVDFYPSVESFQKDFQRLKFYDETILLKGARVFEFERIDQLLSEQIHQTVLEINLNALADNLKQFQQLIRPATKMMAMVKAFSYGGGSFEIANLLQFHRVDYLGVAYADEAIELRKSGINLPMMVMNPEAAAFESLLKYQLEPVIYSFQLLKLFEGFLKKEGILQFPVHVELETGMNRLGFSVHELPALISSLKGSSFKLQSVFSHLAASEETQQDDFTRRQADVFINAANEIQSAFSYPFLKHISNSAAIIRHPDLQLDMVRLGIGLYGIDNASSQVLDLHEVSTLKSTIAQIKHLKNGATVGYNRKGVADGGTTIATVRIGYADGYPRILGSANGKMLVKGHLAPVIGNVCMDMTMIDITGIAGVVEGDEVTIFGNGLPVEQVARWASTIPYEILTGISQRVKRIYYEA